MRGSLQVPAQQNISSKPALLQTRNLVLHGVGPDFLGDAGASKEAAGDAVQGPDDPAEHALPGVHKDPAHASGGIAESLAAVRAKGMKPGGAQSSEPEHVMHLLSTEQAGAKDLVSVRLEHALANANRVMTLFASGVAAGARAAVENVAPADTVSWLAAENGTAEQMPSTQGSSRSSPPPGAMTFFSGAARANATTRRLLKEAKPSSMIAVAIARAAASGANIARVDATGAHVDVLAPRRGPVTVEDQRRALMISEQQLAQQVDEADRARELERQRALEDAMDRTRDASSWGI